MRGPRSLALVAVAACALTPVAAQAATTASAKTSGPASYTLANSKARCRTGYVKTHVTVTVRRHGKRVKLHQVRCVRSGASGGTGVPGGSTLSSGSARHPASTFAVGLPTAAVTLSIIPTASAHTYAIAAGQSLSLGGQGVLSGATGAALSAVLVSGPAQGALSLNRRGTLDYTPAAGASGIQRFSYKVVDAYGETSTPATVTLDVTPLAHDGLYSTPANRTLAIPSGGLLASDTGSGLTAAVVGSTADGSLSVQPDGSATYTPNSGFSGVDTFTYQAVDADSLHSNTATVTISVGAQPPTVTPVTFSGAIANTTLHVGAGSTSGPHVSLTGTSALAGDVDPGGGTLSVTPATITTSAGGSVTLASNGSFNYLPPAGFTGPSDSFGYEVDTSEGTSAAATATIDFASGRVWYLDGSSATDGTGTSASPFNSAASADAAASPGDVIFVLSNYTGGISPGAGVTLEGAGTALVVSGETLLASGSAPQITNGPSPALTLNEGDVVAGVAASGVSASAVNGFTILSSASISNATGGDALDITGGSGTISIGAPITSTSGHSVQVHGRTGGTVTLNGTVGDSGTGILLTGDGGSQVNFNGAITAVTGSSPAFTATGGGSVTATSSTNSLTTTTGVALDMSGGSVVGSQGLQLASVSAGDATHHPANGIVLNGTDGGGTVTIAGGTIEQTTGAGVQLANSGAVSVSGVTISAAGGDGIDADNVSSLMIGHTHVLNSGARGIVVTGDGSVAPQTTGLGFDTVAGQPGTAISLAFGGDAAVTLDNDDQVGNGTLGSGSLTGDGIDLSDTAGQLIAEISQVQIGDIATGMGIAAQELGDPSSTFDLTIDNNTVTGATDGVSVIGGNGAACLNASTNTLAGVVGLAVSQPDASGTFAIEGYTGLPGDLTGISGVQAFLESPPSHLTALATLGLGAAGFTNDACRVPVTITS
ncbi:MAG: beta strand repeat-containing protein [Solirubrobacteraceae bacterium]